MRKSIFISLNLRSIRHFGVNVFKKRFYSPLLEQHIRLKMSSTAFKTMKKYGGYFIYLSIDFRIIF